LRGGRVSMWQAQGEKTAGVEIQAGRTGNPRYMRRRCDIRRQAVRTWQALYGGNSGNKKKRCGVAAAGARVGGELSCCASAQQL